MLVSLLRNLVRRRGAKPAARPARSLSGPIRLHIGGHARHPDWQIVDVNPGPHVDHVGSCTDLTAFGDDSVLAIYASHVLEHLGYAKQLPAALREFHRILAPGGTLYASVPDLDTLCTLFIDPGLSDRERFYVMRMMFGGQVDDADFHHVGLNETILRSYLERAGFGDIVRVGDFGLFDDSSRIVFGGKAISVNLRAQKPARRTGNQNP